MKATLAIAIMFAGFAVVGAPSITMPLSASRRNAAATCWRRGEAMTGQVIAITAEEIDAPRA